MKLVAPLKHKYVSLIEYSLKRDGEEFSADEVCAATGLSAREFNFVRASIFSLNGYQENPYFETGKKHQWILRPEAYFSYLQYREFCHAIEQARKANRMASWAVVVSIIGLSLGSTDWVTSLAETAASTVLTIQSSKSIDPLIEKSNSLIKCPSLDDKSGEQKTLFHKHQRNRVPLTAS